MNNQTKRGFSLVEVMILFTVLAVAMAASLPLITKKSKPVPARASHGVYRCIALGNGKYLEETYNSFRQLKSHTVNACKLDKVPNASVYKIDLYSAGAGGTEYASYMPLNNDSRRSTFTMADAVNYANSGTITFSNRQGEGNGDMPYDLTDENIRLALQNQPIVQTAFSGSGGKGGTATYKYKSPARAVCAALVRGSYKAQEKMNAAKKDWDSAVDKYKQKYDAYEAEIAELQKPIAGYESKINDNNAKVKLYKEHVETLTSYASTMNSLSTLYSTLVSAKTDDARKDAYSNLRAAAATGATGYGLYNVYQNSLMSWNTYSEIAEPLKEVNDDMAGVDSWLNDESKHKRNVYDEKNKTKITGTRNATEAEKLKDLVDSVTQMSVLAGMKEPGGESAGYASSYVTTLNKAIDKLNADTNTQKGEIGKIETKVAEKQKQRDNDTELKNLNDVEIPKLKTAYEERESVYKDMNLETSSVNPRPLIYNNRTDLRVDSDNVYSTPQTLLQIDDYCRNSDATKPTHEFYENKDYNWDGSLGIEPYQAEDSVIQHGGAGGQGKRMQLTYYLTYEDAERNRYSKYSYPFVKYIGDLYGNVNNQGYQLMACTSLTLNSSTCSPGAISDAKDGDDKLEWKIDGLKHIGRAKDGKDVEKVMAYHVPDFKGGPVGNYVTVQTNLLQKNSNSPIAATGGKGAAVGYTENTANYEKSDYETILAWQTFKGDGTTKGANAAASGNNAVLKKEVKEVPKRYTLLGVVDNHSAQPEIRQSATTWTKSYRLGQAGSPGQHSHFQVSSLGDHCSMYIPSGGMTFDYMTLAKEAEDRGLNVDNYLNTQKSLYESSLSASITCYAKDGLIVFNRVLKGGQYNITPTAWSNPFHWRRGVTSHRIEALTSAAPPVVVTPRWAKIFHIGEMSSLAGVSLGGAGTGLTDYCVEPKGEYHFAAYRLQSTNGSPWTETLIGTPFHKTYDGKKNKTFDCYQSDRGEGDYSGPRIFGPANMTSQDRANYWISSPSPGGGGAIIIMW